MAGTPPPPGELGSLPPEVPEEFAAAYRAAYEQAMAAQSVPLRRGEHADGGDDEGGLPRRTRPIRVGAHRDEHAAPNAYERVRDTVWFVPVLLLLLGLLMVLLAYVVGRQFSAHVGVSSDPVHALGRFPRAPRERESGTWSPWSRRPAQVLVSRTSVTGPSLTSDTAMSAPKTPVSTWVPARSSAVRTAS